MLKHVCPATTRPVQCPAEHELVTHCGSEVSSVMQSGALAWCTASALYIVAYYNHFPLQVPQPLHLCYSTSCCLVLITWYSMLRLGSCDVLVLLFRDWLCYGAASLQFPSFGHIPTYYALSCSALSDETLCSSKWCRNRGYNLPCTFLGPQEPTFTHSMDIHRKFSSQRLLHVAVWSEPIIRVTVLQRCFLSHAVLHPVLNQALVLELTWYVEKIFCLNSHSYRAVEPRGFLFSMPSFMIPHLLLITPSNLQLFPCIYHQ